MTKLIAMMTVVTSAIASVAVVVAASTSGTAPATEIGDARVALGVHSARVVEQVGYRDGVIRVADLVLDNGAPVGNLDNADLASAWNIVSSVWPASITADLVQISVIDEGPRGLVGVVHRSVDGGWILSLDRRDFGDRRLVEETIIHEIAHIATLGPDQFSFDLEAACNGVETSVGCAAPGSLMALWASTFWSGGAVDVAASELVDPYAATAVQEDLAETFLAWVAEWPINSGGVEARIEMLKADPAMSALAAEIRDQRG